MELVEGPGSSQKLDWPCDRTCHKGVRELGAELQVIRHLDGPFPGQFYLVGK